MKKSLCILSTCFILLLTACQAQDDVNNDPTIEGQGRGYSEMDTTMTATANHLAELSLQVPEVNHATAIVIGPYALVGIDVDGRLDQSDVGAVKYQVAEALADDPYGAQAAVTADPDYLARIDEMRVEIGQGRPINAIMEELAGIIGRLMPIVPGQEHRMSEDPTDVNDERLPSGRQNELENIQDEQSKGRMNQNN
ncbi:YhcN/YlaJ family sporulation lipoprotein [Evansella cellulosilytica]|uniref:Sporulation lipoprotein, YhcN/YlaJ family n=1 Tax=Evansella cellulosilytica (strain ATCC 21833 / DSM 2522 / FERM P-1141 / JCM 9156 / N-4) TaxID=649639 RepID=E6TUL4_EVAC2|nr:YhcN/YlaJ family sporulation lipoprotein [Evansella cellulosilytica]ADU30904.1 sporulation lipoprotein, YhcN/YlaJ family [Evansella cellulosilytica DSM 2522]